MKFMIIIKTAKNCAASEGMSPEQLAELAKFNEELAKAGVLLGLERLHPPAKGARIRRFGDRHFVTDGPFTESKEVIGGFWLWELGSVEEAIEWLKRCPVWPEDGEVEIRQVLETSDFAQALAELEMQEVRIAASR